MEDEEARKMQNRDPARCSLSWCLKIQGKGTLLYKQWPESVREYKFICWFFNFSFTISSTATVDSAVSACKTLIDSWSVCEEFKQTERRRNEIKLSRWRKEFIYRENKRNFRIFFLIFLVFIRQFSAIGHFEFLSHKRATMRHETNRVEFIWQMSSDMI